MSDRPRFVSFDSERRLHCEIGAAVRFSDGWGVHAIHGRRVPSFIVEAPQTITIDHIEKETNAEVRRIMIERYALGRGDEVTGSAAYIRDAGGKRLDHDEPFGTLWRRDIKDDEPLVMLEVVNSTPEPDGHFKRYWLRVPPTITKAREASAWTFGMSADEYAPEIET